MGFNDPKEFNDPQVLNDPKGISIGNMDFDNPKVYGDTSIFDGLLIFINKKVHHALMMRKHRKISDDVVHCFQMTPFINWPLFIMIFINRKERSKTVSGFFPSPCQTI